LPHVRGGLSLRRLFCPPHHLRAGLHRQSHIPGPRFLEAMVASVNMMELR
jgi:hypothetical protein